jgi:glycosidase
LIYYGDEVGLAGGGDPDNRRMMPRSDAELNPHQLALRMRVAALARIRAENPVVARGTRTTLSATQDTWAWRMGSCTGARDVIVAVNRGDQPRTVALPAGDYDDLLRPGMTASGGNVELSPRGFVVWRSRTP